MIDLTVPQNALLVNQAATAAVTNLVGAALPAPANFLKVGQVWAFHFPFTFLHTAAATPTLTLEFALQGVVQLAQVVTPVAVAATYHGFCRGYLTVRAVGVSGSFCPYITLESHGLTLAAAGAAPTNVATVPTTIDTTIARLIELRLRMTTAVASNTLTIPQGWVERLAG